MEFEWDEKKRLSNVKKHGIDFSDAVEIFDGPVLDMVSDQKYHGENRMVAIGLFNGMEVTVVYTIRENKRRIISARRSRKYEREIFWEAISQD